MIYGSREELVAQSYFSFINDIIGILSMTLAVTALQFKNPQPFAAFFLAVMLLWTFSNTSAIQYKRIASNYLSLFPGIFGAIQLFSKMLIYIIGVVLLFSVAIGLVTEDVVYDLFRNSTLY